KKLNAEKVAPIGRVGYWGRSYVAKLLTSRAAIGEYQPHTGRGGKRRPDGAPIPNYFPAAVSEDEWHAARAALTSRRHKGGRPAPRVNVFANLLHDAVNGGSMHLVNKSGPAFASYLGANGVGNAKFVSFPRDTFERAILSKLREIDPREVLPSD